MYFRRKSLDETPQEDTMIWTCENVGCNSWIRDNFAFDYVPACHQCSSPMVSSVRMLPTINNNNKDMKELKKGRQIMQ